MSDADLRALERAARTDPDARLRYADALERVGEKDAALEALLPLFLRCDGFEAGARLRAGILFAEHGKSDKAAYHFCYRFAREDVIVDAEYRTLAPRLLAIARKGGSLGKQAYSFLVTRFPLELAREEWPRVPRDVRGEVAATIRHDTPQRAIELSEVEPEPTLRAYLKTGRAIYDE